MSAMFDILAGSKSARESCTSCQRYFTSVSSRTCEFFILKIKFEMKRKKFKIKTKKTKFKMKNKNIKMNKYKNIYKQNKQKFQ
jgi:hypothetical protein